MGVATIRAAGLGELIVAQDSDDLLTAPGLGSCVGIAAYEKTARIAILAHVMLPGPPTAALDPSQAARYAGPAVDAIMKQVEARGGSTKNLVIKLAGGAQVIQLAGKEDKLRIGFRNIEAVREALKVAGLRVTAEDTGGHQGRTIIVHAADGSVTVRVVGQTAKPL